MAAMTLTEVINALEISSSPKEWASVQSSMKKHKESLMLMERYLITLETIAKHGFRGPRDVKLFQRVFRKMQPALRRAGIVEVKCKYIVEATRILLQRRLRTKLRSVMCELEAIVGRRMVKQLHVYAAVCKGCKQRCGAPGTDALIATA